MRWFRSHWDEDDIWFYFEADADGSITRQIELRCSDGTFTAAASATEWETARQNGTLAAYEETFGATAEVPIHKWDDHDEHALAREEFEAVWRTARQALSPAHRSTPVRPLGIGDGVASVVER